MFLWDWIAAGLGGIEASIDSPALVAWICGARLHAWKSITHEWRILLSQGVVPLDHSCSSLCVLRPGKHFPKSLLSRAGKCSFSILSIRIYLDFHKLESWMGETLPSKPLSYRPSTKQAAFLMVQLLTVYVLVVILNFLGLFSLGNCTHFIFFCLWWFVWETFSISLCVWIFDPWWVQCLGTKNSLGSGAWLEEACHWR